MFLILSNSVIIETSSYNSCQPCSNSVPLAIDSDNGCSGAKVKNVTPKIVSGLVVKTGNFLDEFSNENLI